MCAVKTTVLHWHSGSCLSNNKQCFFDLLCDVKWINFLPTPSQIFFCFSVHLTQQNSGASPGIAQKVMTFALASFGNCHATAGFQMHLTLCQKPATSEKFNICHSCNTHTNGGIHCAAVFSISNMPLQFQSRWVSTQQ